MVVLDVPYVPAQESALVIAEAPATSGGAPDYILNECKETESTGEPWSAMRAVDPAYMLKNYLQLHEKKGISVPLADIKTTMLEKSAHGTLSSSVTNTGRVVYRYDAIPDYVGSDRAVFMAEYEGKTYRVVVELHVFQVVNENSPTCPPHGTLIKVKKGIGSTSEVGEEPYLSIGFMDLSGGAVGQVVGSTITLDTDAAGNGWFVDSTPRESEEYTPTSNPNEWIAKPGSDAAGKMDMVTVLLHEYGHVLGLDHSSDSHSLMSAELKPGVRHTVSEAEMQAISDYLAKQDPNGTTNETPTPKKYACGISADVA